MAEHPDYKKDAFRHDGRNVFRQWRIVYREFDTAERETDISVRLVRDDAIDAYCYRTQTWRTFDPARIVSILNLKTNRPMQSFHHRYGVAR